MGAKGHPNKFDVKHAQKSSEDDSKGTTADTRTYRPLNFGKRNFESLYDRVFSARSPTPSRAFTEEIFRVFTEELFVDASQAKSFTARARTEEVYENPNGNAHNVLDHIRSALAAQSPNTNRLDREDPLARGQRGGTGVMYVGSRVVRSLSCCGTPGDPQHAPDFGTGCWGGGCS
eukprot:1180822-Prorocentrum_minimum.AAC.1